MMTISISSSTRLSVRCHFHHRSMFYLIPTFCIIQCHRNILFHHDSALVCFVLGDKFSDYFPVEILSTKTVDALKEAIKRKKEFSLERVEASSLELWKVSIPLDQLGEMANDMVPLHSTTNLSDIFTDFSDLPIDHVHILVKKPPCTFPPSLPYYVF